NGYARMDRLLDNVLRRTDRLDRLISSQKDMLKQHAVTCLLHSSVEGASSLCGLDFAYDHFAVVLLFFNETMDTTMESAERNARLMASAQILREACSAWNAPYLLLHGHMAVLLFNLPQDTLSAVQMQELTESIRACSHRGQAEQCFLGASISAVVSGVERIHAAYAEALSWVNYALLSPPQEEAIYHSQSDKAREPVITSAQEELLISTVASGKTEAALKLFDQLCLPLQGAPTVPHFAKCFFYHIVACLVRSVRGGNGTQWMEAELCALEQATNIVGQQDAVRRAVETIANHHAQTQKDSGNVLLEEIFQLIACHYADPDFNATQIARMTERNPSYLSKYFQDCTGMGLYDYLLRFRIAKAKELIDHSDAPISSLIHQAGFENPGSFIRIFKKFEGITPGVYQNRPKSQ
ncbi:MAG: helix-turn-helix domain-containing protein, partial [Clostridia bacterium]